MISRTAKIPLVLTLLFPLTLHLQPKWNVEAFSVSKSLDTSPSCLVSEVRRHGRRNCLVGSTASNGVMATPSSSSLSLRSSLSSTSLSLTASASSEPQPATPSPTSTTSPSTATITTPTATPATTTATQRTQTASLLRRLAKLRSLQRRLLNKDNTRNAILLFLIRFNRGYNVSSSNMALQSKKTGKEEEEDDDDDNDQTIFFKKKKKNKKSRNDDNDDDDKNDEDSKRGRIGKFLGNVLPKFGGDDDNEGKTAAVKTGKEEEEGNSIVRFVSKRILQRGKGGEDNDDNSNDEDDDDNKEEKSKKRQQKELEIREALAKREEKKKKQQQQQKQQRLAKETERKKEIEKKKKEEEEKKTEKDPMERAKNIIKMKTASSSPSASSSSSLSGEEKTKISSSFVLPFIGQFQKNETKNEGDDEEKNTPGMSPLGAAQSFISGMWDSAFGPSKGKEEWIVVCPKTWIAPGQIVPVVAAGLDLIIVASMDGRRLHCVANSCPHLGTPLEMGQLKRIPVEKGGSGETKSTAAAGTSLIASGEGGSQGVNDGCEDCIVCPLHRTAFALESGEVRGEWCPYPPVLGKMMGAVKPKSNLPTFAVRTRGKNIEVRLSSSLNEEESEEESSKSRSQKR